MSLVESQGHHKLLARQLAECLADGSDLPPQWQKLVALVNQSYLAFDQAVMETEWFLNAISSIMIGVDANDCISRWNRGAEMTFGLPGEQILGKPFMAAAIQWEWLEVLENIAECRDGNQPTLLEDVAFVRPDGQQGYVRLTINPIRTDKSLHYGYLLIGAEITENKLLKQQLAQAQKLEAIGHLAAGIAHELNTPIQYIGDNVRFVAKAFEGIQLFIEACEKLLDSAGNTDCVAELLETASQLRRKCKIDFMRDEVPAALKETQEGVARISEIVKAMKEYAHPGGKEKSPTDINQTLRNAVTVTTNEWKYHAELITNLCPDLPLVPCMPGDIHQVFINLIVNACHAITAANHEFAREKGRITISTEYDRNQVRVVIADDGSGVPEAYRHKIFDPFFTTKEVGKGTGQGLAISHNVVVKKHGGKISFDTELGKGTTFYLSLPLAGEEMVEA